ncbi:MAG: tetratricopeptide repeat protein [Cyanobacteria bacterium]|nr:tetratricopeptide repeat protein [Cyanobacteriota bacterium]
MKHLTTSIKQKSLNNSTEEVPLARGNLLFAMGKFKEALDLTSRMSKSFLQLELRGRCLKAMGRLEEAKQSQMMALKVIPGCKNELYFVVRGHILSELGRDKEALADFSRCIVLNPRNAHYLYNRACCLDKLGFRKEALDDIYLAIKLMPDNVHLYTTRAKILIELGQPGNALLSLEPACKECPDNVVLFACRIHILLQMGRRNEALAALEANSKDLRLQLERANLLLGLGEVTKAVNAYNQALSCCKSISDSASVHETLAGVFEQSREFRKAVDERILALTGAPTVTNLVKLECDLREVPGGIGQLRLSQARKVVVRMAEFKKKLQLPPSLDSLMVKLYQKIGDLDKALQLLSSMIASDATSDLLTQRAAIYFDHRRLECKKADEDLTRAISLSKVSSPELYRLRAKVRMVRGQTEEAVSDLTEVIRLTGAPAKELACRGALLMEENRINDALKDFDRSLTIEETAFSRGRRGQLHYRLGHLEQAVVDISAALQKNPKPSLYYWLRAQANRRLGKLEDSLCDVRVLLDRTPTEKSLQEMQDSLMRKIRQRKMRS